VLATLLSATLIALDGRVIRVEVDVAPGLPGFTIVGLADVGIREARERVRGALRNAGFVHPPRRITVNLAPADLPKTGTAADLAIAIGILIGSEQFTPRAGRAALIGELSLGGEVRSVPGLLPMVLALARRGVARVVVPADGAAEARLAEGVEILPAASIPEAVDALRARRRSSPRQPDRVELATAGVGDAAPPGAVAVANAADAPDLADVRGHAEARRALEVALAGGHGLLLMGPPGTGKTLLARTIPGLQPALEDDEALTATIVASVSGEGPIVGLVRRAPYRAPHHTSSYAAMVGGGPALAPGEVTRADHGVLFLDELAEFSRDVLEALRQPLEDGRVTIVRARGAVTLPARFQLVAAMNPCPCGHAGGEGGACVCHPGVPEKYVGRISGPLRDRIDLWVGMPRIPARVMLTGPEPEASAAVAARIAAARARQLARPGRALNARTSGRMLRAAARLSPSDQARLASLSEAERLSGRGTERLLRVARTIADLAEADAVRAPHLDEAARWRAPAARPLNALAL
jgi:magnesium chelatase family protein